MNRRIPSRAAAAGLALGLGAVGGVHAQATCVGATELGQPFTRGMQDNAAREEFSKSIPGTLRLAKIFSTKKELVAGERFSVGWVPGVGATVLVNGRSQGDPIRGPEFFNALMGIWLGKSPDDAQLEDALLGQARASAMPHQP